MKSSVYEWAAGRLHSRGAAQKQNIIMSHSWEKKKKRVQTQSKCAAQDGLLVLGATKSTHKWRKRVKGGGLIVI